MISIDDTVGEIRRQLDEITLSGDLAVYANEFEDLFSSEFSDNDLRDRVVDGARFIAARVRANYQTDNIRTLSSNNSGEIEKGSDRIVPDPRAENVQPFIRLLSTRVEAVGGFGTNVIQSRQAQRRTLLGNEKIEATGRAASQEEPAYVYEDYEFIFEQGSGTEAAEAAVVDMIVPTYASFNGTSYTYNDGGTSEVPLPEMMQEALVQYVISGCFMTLASPEQAQRARQKMFSELRPFLLPGTLGAEQDDES